MEDGEISSHIRAKRMDFKMVSKIKGLILLGFKDVRTPAKHTTFTLNHVAENIQYLRLGAQHWGPGGKPPGQAQGRSVIVNAGLILANLVLAEVLSGNGTGYNNCFLNSRGALLSSRSIKHRKQQVPQKVHQRQGEAGNGGTAVTSAMIPTSRPQLNTPTRSPSCFRKWKKYWEHKLVLKDNPVMCFLKQAEDTLGQGLAWGYLHRWQRWGPSSSLVPSVSPSQQRTSQRTKVHQIVIKPQPISARNFSRIWFCLNHKIFHLTVFQQYC